MDHLIAATPQWKPPHQEDPHVHSIQGCHIRPIHSLQLPAQLWLLTTRLFSPRRPWLHSFHHYLLYAGILLCESLYTFSYFAIVEIYLAAFLAACSADIQLTGDTHP